MGTIFEGKVENNGYYTCRVKNKLGSDRTRALLTVKKVTAEDVAKMERKKSIALERKKSQAAKLKEQEEKKLAKIAEAAKKPEPKPAPRPEPPKPQKTWGKSGSKKVEPPKAEPEKKVEIKLKKAEPGKKP